METRDQVRKMPLRKCKATPAPLKCKTTTAPEKSAEDYQSSIARHLVDRSDCANCYVDSSFSVLCFGRSKRHLEVLEAVCILSRKPDLFAQKYNLAATVRLFRTSSRS